MTICVDASAFFNGVIVITVSDCVKNHGEAAAAAMCTITPQHATWCWWPSNSRCGLFTSHCSMVNNPISIPHCASVTMWWVASRDQLTWIDVPYLPVRFTSDIIERAQYGGKRTDLQKWIYSVLHLIAGKRHVWLPGPPQRAGWSVGRGGATCVGLPPGQFPGQHLAGKTHALGFKSLTIYWKGGEQSCLS